MLSNRLNQYYAVLPSTVKKDVTGKGMYLDWLLSLLHLTIHPRNFRSHPGNCEPCISSLGNTLPLETRRFQRMKVQTDL